MPKLRDADLATYHMQRTTVLLELRRYEQAAREVRRALQHVPNHAEGHRLLATALWGQGKLEQAQSAAEKALGLAPNDADIHNTLAEILHRLSQYDKAQEHYERALALAPQVAAFHRRYALFLLSKHAASMTLPKVLGAAQREAETALELDPQSAPAHLVYAGILRLQGCLRQAERAIREALAISPNDARAHEMLGDIHIDLKRGPEAFASFREALRLDPTSRSVKRKMILSLQSRLPVIRWFWRLGQQSNWENRVAWTVLTGTLVVLRTLAGWSKVDLTAPNLTFYALIALWGLFLWAVDPVITYGVIKGWIKI